VAVAMGYSFDEEARQWDASGVEDEHYKHFGSTPPDVLGDESKATQTATLAHLASQLCVDDDDDPVEKEKLDESLHVIIETLHGVEMTKIQLADQNDHQFHKRVVVVKWLHLRGGF